MKKLLFVIVMVSISYMAAAFQPANQNTSDGNILLPAQLSSNYYQAATKNFTDTEKWKNFVKTNGDFNVMLDNVTGKIHRAFGKPIKIEGYDNITEANIREASFTFLKKYGDAIGIDPDNIKFLRASDVESKWYVTYIQVYKGLEVLLSEIELRISYSGKVFAFGVDYFDDINISEIPSVSPSDALKNSATGLNYDEKTDRILSNNKLFILPVKKAGTVDYHLVYNNNVEIREPSANYNTYIDAHSGGIIWRQNTWFNATTNITSQGAIKKKFAIDEPEVVGFTNNFINVGGTMYTTSKDGKTTVDISAAKQVTALLEGDWTKVTCKNHTTASFTGTIQAGEDFTIDWNDNNSHSYERCLYNYANIVHNYIRALDSKTTFMDFQLKLIIDFSGSAPNAGSSGQTIQYVAAGKPEMRLAESSSVLYHEYGHSVNTLLYNSLGRSQGMINMSCHEGTADVFAALINDTPEMAPGIYTSDPNKIFRTIDNNLIYPDSILGEGHHDGQILSGAFWDLRKKLGIPIVEKLFHFAKYGMPDDADVGIAFGEWLLEVIITDDDDGDLTNGTPHLLDILQAFNNHHIGTNLFIASSCVHTPLPNTEDTINPYTVNFTIKSQVYSLTKLDSMQVVYSTNNFRTQTILPAVPTSGTSFKADIPAQQEGTSVRYFIKLFDKGSGLWVKFMKNTNLDIPYNFLVGQFKRVYFDDFEKPNVYEWKIGDAQDNILQGKWELARPNEISLPVSGGGTIKLQPGSGYSGNICFVTGPLGNYQNFYGYMPFGRTSIISPDFYISSIANPLIKYYK